MDRVNQIQEVNEVSKAVNFDNFYLLKNFSDEAMWLMKVQLFLSHNYRTTLLNCISMFHIYLRHRWTLKAQLLVCLFIWNYHQIIQGFHRTFS